MKKVDKFKVTTEIRNILLGNENIQSAVSDKIFPLVAHKNTSGDFILYQRDGFKQEYTKMGVCRRIPIVFINVVSDDYDRSQDIASLVYDALEGDFSGPEMKIRLEDSTEDYIDGKYIQVLSFSID